MWWYRRKFYYGPKDVKKCCEIFKYPIKIVTHLDYLADCICTSETIKKCVKENKLQERVIIPKDGDIISL